MGCNYTSNTRTVKNSKANKHKPLTFDRAIKQLALGWHIVRFMNGPLFNGTNYYMTPSCANPNNVATLYPLDKLVFYQLLNGSYAQAGPGSCAFKNCYIGTSKAVQLYL